MKKIITTLGRIRKELNVLLVISLVLVTCIEFWWRRLPPAFGWSDAHVLADVVSNLLLAYVASWIFFLVADHWERQEEEEGQAEIIITAFSGIFEAFIQLSKNVNRHVRPEVKIVLTDLHQEQFDAYSEFGQHLAGLPEYSKRIGILAVTFMLPHATYKTHYLTLKARQEHLPIGSLAPLEVIDFHFDALNRLSTTNHDAKGAEVYGEYTLHMAMLYQQVWALHTAIQSDPRLTRIDWKRLMEIGD